MTKVKKLIAGILSAVIICSLMPVVIGAEENDSGFDYASDAWRILRSAGIIDEDEEYISDREITRSEIVKYLIKLSFYSPITYTSSASGFTDIDDSDADSGYIKAAVSAGLIHGYGDGTFRPDESVTYEQATKMLISLLGYEQIAELSGGYPYGYNSIAEQLDIFKHVNRNYLDNYVTQDNMMVMLLNAAEADLADTLGSINGEISAYGRKRENLFSENFSIYSTEAVIDANEFTSLLSDDGGTNAGYVKADGIVYAENGTGAADYLGMRVKMYYYQPDENDIPEVIYLRPSEKKNSVVEINTKDIEGLEDSSRLVYYINDTQRKSIKLSKIFYFIENGRMSVFDEAKLKAAVGTVKLIDNDGDNQYDVLSLMHYTSYVVSDVSLITETINTKQSIALKLNEEDVITIIKKNGRNASISEIKKGMVISYAETTSGEIPVRTLVLSDVNVTGVIEGYSEDGITVDGVTYDALPAALEHIRIGNTGTIYIDAFGNVVYSECEYDFVYGYLNMFGMEEFEEDIFCKIFTENGRWVTLYLSDKVKYNGKTTKKSDVYTSIGTDPLVYRQLIRYKVNDDAKITTIETAEKLTVMGTAEDEQLRKDDRFRLSYKNESASDDSRYVTTAKSFMGKISVDANTVIFSVPDQSDGIKPEEFGIMSMSDLYGDYQYTFLAYDASEVRTAGAMVITNCSKVANDPDNVSQLLFVTGTGQMLNAEDEVVDAVIGFYGSDEELWFPIKIAEPPANLHHEASLIKDVSELKYGDIVQLVFNSSGNVERIDRWIKSGAEYSFLGDWGTSTSDTELYIRAGFIAGRVKAASAADNRVVMQYTEEGKTIQLLTNNNTKVFIYSDDSKEFKRGSLSDILKNDKIYVSERYLVCKEIIIMR